MNKFLTKNRHRLILLIILIFASILRIYMFSGDGLGDDPNFFASYYRIFDTHKFLNHNLDYRISIWLPILTIFKIFGINEYSWISYILITSLANIILIYFILKELYSKEAGLIGASLLAVAPFDVAFSTMFAMDIPMTFFMFTSFYFFIKAQRTKISKHFFLSALFLFFGYLAKVTVLYLIPVYIIFILFDHKNIKKYTHFFLYFFSFLILFLIFSYILTGDFLSYYHSELKSAGPGGEMNKFALVQYPQHLFLPNEYNTFMHGSYMYIALLCLIFFFNNKKSSYKLFILLISLFLMMEFLPFRIDNWKFYSVPRIYRYLAILVIPYTLVISFFMYRLYQYKKKIFITLFLIFLIISSYQAYTLAFVTKDAFSDLRDASNFIKILPPKPIHSDFLMMSRIERFNYQLKRPELIKIMLMEDKKSRQEYFDNIKEGYVITGGSRLPYYGCERCINKVEDLKIPNNWKLIKEFNKPKYKWRTETMRIWGVT